MPAVIMFLNGLAVMVFEMVGARLLAPWLGTSVVVWTSLIGVILAGLSLGYWLGGRLADSRLGGPASGGKRDKKESQAAVARAWGLLSRILIAAAAFVVCAALLQESLLPYLTTAIPSLHLATLVAALLLFAVPSVLCGMVSPYVIRLAIQDNPHSGRTIGALTALSTIGSIVGTFLGGFVLISYFGSREITLGTAGCLLLAAFCAKARPLAPKFMIIGLIAACGFLGHITVLAQAQAGTYIFESAYNTMRVSQGIMDGRATRFLMTDPGSSQSGMYLDDPTDLVFSYTRWYALATRLAPSSKRVLMLGGGGYSVPKWILSGKSGLDPNQVSVDVVELDPGITRVAGEFFNAPITDPRLRIFHEDARIFLNTRAAKAGTPDKAYDLIFGDVFNSYYTVPFHMGTVEAAQKIHALLADDGIFMMNVIAAVEGDNGRLLRGIHAAYAQVFDEVHVFPVQLPQHPEMVQNVMLMAFRRPHALRPDDPAHPELARFWPNRYTKAMAADVPALRDNFAPVERYTLGYLQ